MPVVVLGTLILFYTLFIRCRRKIYQWIRDPNFSAGICWATLPRDWFDGPLIQSPESCCEFWFWPPWWGAIIVQAELQRGKQNSSEKPINAS